VAGRERERPDRSEIAVVVVGIVPAVREAGSDAEPWRDGISQEQSGVGVWRPQRVEKGPREVEVLGTLVDLVADQGGPLPSFHGEAVAYRNEIRRVGLGQVHFVGVPEQGALIVAVAKDAERVVLLRVDPARHYDAVTETIALGRVLLDAQFDGVEGVLIVVIVESQLVDVTMAGLPEVPHITVFEVPEEHELLEIGLRLAVGRRGPNQNVRHRLLRKRRSGHCREQQNSATDNPCQSNHRAPSPSRARFKARTFTRRSPRTPSQRPSVFASTSSRTAATSIFRAFATRWS